MATCSGSNKIVINDSILIKIKRPHIFGIAQKIVVHNDFASFDQFWARGQKPHAVADNTFYNVFFINSTAGGRVLISSVYLKRSATMPAGIITAEYSFKVASSMFSKLSLHSRGARNSCPKKVIDAWPQSRVKKWTSIPSSANRNL